MASSSVSSPVLLEDRVRRRWYWFCAIVGIVLCVSQLFEIPARSALRGYDNTFNYLWLRSAMVDHDWDFRNDLEQCNTLTPEYRAAALALRTTPTGRIPNKYGVGWATLTLPFYLVADLLVSAGRAAHLWSFANDGFNPVYQICIQIGHVLLALLALKLAIEVVDFWVDDRTAAVAGVVCTWAASPLLYYQSMNVSMNHGAAFFAIAVLAYSLVRTKRANGNLGWWLMAGAGWGLATVVRYQLIVFILSAVWCAWKNQNTLRSRTRVLLLFTLGAAPWLLLQSLAWHSVYGDWFVFSYGAEGESFHWGNPAVISSLFSPWHGLFYWHPFLVVGFVGMASWAWRKRGSAIAWSAVFGVTIYLNAAWWCWWFASAFGSRGCDAALLPLMAGVGWLFARLKPNARAFLWCVAIVFGTWNFYVAVLYRTGAISRSEPVTWTQMLEGSRDLGDALHF